MKVVFDNVTPENKLVFDNTTNETPEKKENKNSHLVWIILLIVALIATYYIFNYVNKQKNG